MAEYINPTSLDSGMKGGWQQYVTSPLPFEVDREQQKNQIADQMYQNALQQSNLDLASAQRKGTAEQQTEDILGRMRTDPRFAQAMIQAGINEQLGKGGEGASKYINAVQQNRDVLFGPMFQTKDQGIQDYLLRSGQQQLADLGLSQPTLPTNLQQAMPILQAQNARYRADQDFRMKQDITNAQLANALEIARINAQARETVAGMRGARRGAGGGTPTPFKVWLSGFIEQNGRSPTPQEINDFRMATSPLSNPAKVEENAVVKDRFGRMVKDYTNYKLGGGTLPLSEFKAQWDTRYPRTGAAQTAPKPTGPAGFTSKGGVKFTVE